MLTDRLRLAGCATLLSAFMLTIAVATADAQTLLRVGKAGREAFSFVPVDIGDQLGIFKKHGVAVEIASFSGEAKLQQAMAADSIDISLASGVGIRAYRVADALPLGREGAQRLPRAESRQMA